MHVRRDEGNIGRRARARRGWVLEGSLNKSALVAVGTAASSLQIGNSTDERSIGSEVPASRQDCALLALQGRLTNGEVS